MTEPNLNRTLLGFISVVCRGKHFCINILFSPCLKICPRTCPACVARRPSPKIASSEYYRTITPIANGCSAKVGRTNRDIFGTPQSCAPSECGPWHPAIDSQSECATPSGSVTTARANLCFGCSRIRVQLCSRSPDPLHNVLRETGLLYEVT